MAIVRTDRPSTLFLFFQNPMSFLKAKKSKTECRRDTAQVRARKMGLPSSRTRLNSSDSPSPMAPQDCCSAAMSASQNHNRQSNENHSQQRSACPPTHEGSLERICCTLCPECSNADCGHVVYTSLVDLTHTGNRQPCCTEQGFGICSGGSLRAGTGLQHKPASTACLTFIEMQTSGHTVSTYVSKRTGWLQGQPCSKASAECQQGTCGDWELYGA